MSIQSFFKSLTSPSTRRRPSRRRAQTSRLRLEALEDRTMPSTFTVTNLLDSGPDSLRTAVAAANANPGADAIDFAVTGTIGLTSGELDITDSLTINGPGAGALTVSGSQVSRVFGIAGDPTVTIAGLTVAYGWSDSGGGIFMAGGTLTLDQCTVSGNSAGGAGGSWYLPAGDGLGGGLYVAGGTLTLDQCTVSGNSAVGGAGFSEIDQGYNGGYGAGGGLYVAGGAVRVNQSTVSGNGAYGGAGGDGVVDHNYTIGGVGGDARGGGISVVGGSLEIRQSSIFDNTALGGQGGLSFSYPGSQTYAGSGVGQGGGLSIAPYAPPIADLDTYTESHTINNVADIDPNISGPYSVIGTSTQPSTFTVSGFPATTMAGVAGSFTITAKNADGSIDTGYTGAVHFTSSDWQAGLPSDYAFTVADGGVHIFSATLKTAGTQSLTATDTVTNSITGNSAVTVSPATASTMLVSGFPSPITAGAAGNFTVTLKDSYGNIASGYTGTVHFTSSDGKASLPANYSFTAADAGVHTFSAILKTAGTQSLTATDTTAASLTGTDGGITVKPAAASKFLIGAPASVHSGVAFSLTVTVQDAYGNVVTGYTGTVHFTSTDNKATLPANYTFTASDKGVHTFTGLVLRKRGTQKITLTDTLNSSLTGGVTENVL